MEAPTSTPQSTDAQTRTHHKYGPSKMGYIDECAAYKSSDGTSEAADQGTFLHDLMDKMLGHVKGGNATTTLEQIDKWVRPSVDLTDDEIEYLRFCCKRVDKYLASKPTKIFTEIDVRANDPITGKNLNHGFLDVLFIFGDLGILIDFKFGWVAVKEASKNLQGVNYAVGCFQMFSELKRIGVEFQQPKLGRVTSTMFKREELAGMFGLLKLAVDRAEFVQANPDQAQKFMKAGTYCTYCALAGTCTVLNNMRLEAGSKFAGLPVPKAFSGLELASPEQIALARYYVDLIENGVGLIKSRAFELAEQNGGSISCTLPSGEVVTYQMQERNADRSLGSAVEVAEALKEIVSPEEILGAAELAITKLEPIVKNAFIELAKAEGRKLTKKAAWEQGVATLEAHGLLTRPDRKVKFLKLVKSTKQIEQPK